MSKASEYAKNKRPCFMEIWPNEDGGKNQLRAWVTDDGKLNLGGAVVGIESIPGDKALKLAEWIKATWGER